MRRKPHFLFIIDNMTYKDEKLGVFIVPTGVGASIGGYAGDASNFAREFTQFGKLIVNPNVVNAGCFSGINEKMLYFEGYAIDELFKGNKISVPSINDTCINRLNNLSYIFER